MVAHVKTPPTKGGVIAIGSGGAVLDATYRADLKD